MIVRHCVLPVAIGMTAILSSQILGQSWQSNIVFGGVTAITDDWPSMIGSSSEDILLNGSFTIKE